VDLKAGYNTGDHQQQDSVDNKGKKTEGQDGQGQGQNKEDGPEKGIQDAQECCGEKGGKKATDRDPLDQIGGKHYSDGQNQPSY